jgi:hypothetical protein
MYYPGAAGVISPQGQVLCKFEKQSARTRMLITTLFASLTDGFALREAQTLAEARRYLPKSINGIRDRAIRISKYLEEIIA